MNKRQAKKQSKKKYGCNSNQYSEQLLKTLQDIDFRKLGESIGKVIRTYLEALNEATEVVKECLQNLS